MVRSCRKLFVGNVIIIEQELTYKIVREGTAFVYLKEYYKLLDALEDFCLEVGISFRFFRIIHFTRIINKFKKNVI